MERISHSSDSVDIVIIGAGIGGLICANHLADRGFADDLLVVEARSEPGGRARSECIGGGALNLGPHALGLGGPLAATLRNWDLWPEGEKVRGGWALSDDQLYRLPTSPLSLLRTRLFPGLARARYAALIATMRRLDPEDFRTQSAREFLDARCGDPRVRRGLAALARLSTYVADFGRLSADVLVERFQHTLDGVLYVDGGWQTMVDGLMDRLSERGVVVRCDSRVESIEKTTESVRIHLGADVIGAEAVILAVGPSGAARLLGDDLAQEIGLDQKPEPVRAACLDLVLERWPNENVDLCVGVAEPVYLSNHSRYARLSDRERQVVHAAYYRSRSKNISSEAIGKRLEALLDRTQPGWRAAVIERRFLPRMKVVEQMPQPATSGMAGRPAPSPEGLKNVFLVGDWVGDSGWLADASASSARGAAAAVGHYLTGATTDRRYAPQATSFGKQHARTNRWLAR